MGREFGREGKFINKRIFNFKWFGEWHDPQPDFPELEGGVSQPRGRGGEALTHTFSMPEPSLPGPGRVLTVFSREDFEKPQASSVPAFPPSFPKGPRVPDGSLHLLSNLYSVLGEMLPFLPMLLSLQLLPVQGSVGFSVLLF